MITKRYARIEDDELVALYAGGCNEAFDALLERHTPYIHNYIRAHIQEDSALIEDIFQDTFIKVMTTIRSAQYNAEGKFRSWLTRIAHNLIIDHFRREKREARFHPIETDEEGNYVLDNIASDEPNGEEIIIAHNQLSELYDKLTRLPMEQREVVMLRYWSDMSFREIADITGVSINTALGRMRYALVNLRKVM